MKIALFPSAYHPSVGGVEELVRQLCLALGRDGVEAIVLTNRWPRDLPEHEWVDGVEVYRPAMRVPCGRLKAHVSYHLTHRRIQRQTEAILRQHEIDVLHVQCVSCNAPYALRAGRRLGLPVVVTTQGELTMDANGIYTRPGYSQSAFGRALTQADAVTGCSKQTLEEAEAFCGRSAEGRGLPGRVIYNGIDLREYDGVTPHEHPRPYVFAIGRHVKQKGFDVLLRAWAGLAERQGGERGYDLLLAGDGTEHEPLKALAGELGLGERVRFLGRVDHAAALRLYKGCAFFVLPSRHEPFGIVNLEAMASGKAVVATRVGGVPEFVEDGQTGLLVEPEDEAALGEAMGRLMDDPALRDRLGGAGQAAARGFDWGAIAKAYQNVYAELRETNPQREAVKTMAQAAT